jgi:hypothetical protein
MTTVNADTGEVEDLGGAVENNPLPKIIVDQSKMVYGVTGFLLGGVLVWYLITKCNTK